MALIPLVPALISVGGHTARAVWWIVRTLAGVKGGKSAMITSAAIFAGPSLIGFLIDLWGHKVKTDIVNWVIPPYDAEVEVILFLNWIGTKYDKPETLSKAQLVDEMDKYISVRSAVAKGSRAAVLLDRVNETWERR